MTLAHGAAAPPRLTAANADGAAADRPMRGRPSASGIVHIGVGAFHRAHQAVMTEDAMLRSGDDRWGITAATQRSGAAADSLSPQDLLYTVVQRGPNAARARIVSSLTGVLRGDREPAAMVAAIADPGVQVVTVTVTEGGYRLRADGTLDLDDAETREDLAGRPPRTTVGQLARGLQLRAATQATPISVVSCDNLNGNGHVLGSAVETFLSEMHHGTEAQSWVSANVTFPSTMVDRIVPATTPKDLRTIAAELGRWDAAAVVTEPFIQWVIEDRFAGDRPAWELAGATLTDLGTVSAWESAKLAILNGCHTMIASLGLLGGLGEIATTVRDPRVDYAARAMAADALHELRAPVGADLDAYVQTVMTRFQNPVLRHAVTQVGSDGSKKVPIRILPIIRSARSHGRMPRWSTFAVASWIVSVEMGVARDSAAGSIRAMLSSSNSTVSAMERLLSGEQLGARDLADDVEFTTCLAAGVESLRRWNLGAVERWKR